MINRIPSPIRERVPEGAGIGLIFLFALAVWLGTRYVDQASWVRHTLEVETHIGKIWSLVQDIEIGQRSFVLTGDERFLTRFEGAKTEIFSELDYLKMLVTDNPKQIARIGTAQPMIGERIAFADKTVALRRQGDVDGARDLIASGHGADLTDDVREQLELLHDEESALLRMREVQVRNTTGILTVAVASAFLAILAALAAWIVNARRSAREIADTNKRLEQSIAEREAAEMQVRQMQKIEAVGQLTGGIAHDFNNMLAIIISGISLAQKRLAAGATGAEEFLNGALEGANRAASLVKRLLAFARQQPLAPSVIDANKFVGGLSELISRALGEAINTEIILGGGLWNTRADAVQLENSLLNLCVNARDAMPDGGRLTVETANCHLDDRYSRMHPGVPAGQYVLIAVTDTGTGMTPEVLNKAFDPFFSTKEPTKGTGLGLSQVYGFVKQSGGHIKVYSELGQGTTVKIYLPRHYGSAADLAGKAVIGSQPGGSEIILLVEDDPRVLELTAASLREFGYTVIEARGAMEALGRLDAGQTVDLLLTDIVMPEVGGRKLAEQAVVRRPGLKVVYMTGFTKNAVVHNGVLDPGVHFLAKPFSLEELSNKIREALDGIEP